MFTTKINVNLFHKPVIYRASKAITSAHRLKSSKDGRILLDLMDIFHLVNLIKDPTRVTNTSETLIDLILTNNKKKVLISGVFDAQISDHVLVYAILRLTTPRFNSRKVCTRSYKNFDKNAIYKMFHFI